MWGSCRQLHQNAKSTSVEDVRTAECNDQSCWPIQLGSNKEFTTAMKRLLARLAAVSLLVLLILSPLGALPACAADAVQPQAQAPRSGDPASQPQAETKRQQVPRSTPSNPYDMEALRRFDAGSHRD
jgi:hypothetical protein